MSRDYIIALWYETWAGEDYELYDDEADAASHAAFLHLGGSDYVSRVLGVQYPDGRVVKAADWAALPGAVEEERQSRARRDAAERSRPPIVYRKARGPFTGRDIDVEASEPQWLGVPR